MFFLLGMKSVAKQASVEILGGEPMEAKTHVHHLLFMLWYTEFGDYKYVEITGRKLVLNKKILFKLCLIVFHLLKIWNWFFPGEMVASRDINTCTVFGRNKYFSQALKSFTNIMLNNWHRPQY